MEPIKKLDKQELRKFGLITGAIVAVLFGLLLPFAFGKQIPTWPWVLTGTLWLLAGLVPMALQPIYRGWMKVGFVLGWVNTRILLGLVFYLMIFPMGRVMRIFRKDPLARKIDADLSTYRVKSRVLPKQHMERPF